MLDPSCCHDGGRALSPAFDARRSTAADVIAEVVEVVGFDPLSISMLYGNPMGVAIATVSGERSTTTRSVRFERSANA